MDITSGDLNGDMYDNIIAAWECANHSIAICIPNMIKDSLGWDGTNITMIDSVLNSRIRLFTGDFDRDRQKEFVLAYHGLDGYVHISLYQTDSLLILEKLAEIADFALGTSTLFDLAAGNLDGDAQEEVVYGYEVDFTFHLFGYYTNFINRVSSFEIDPEFVSSYEYTSSSDKQVETEVHGDWGISASLSAGGSFLGVGAKTTLTTKYGEGFSKSELNRYTMVIEQKAYARVDDEIYATITDYSFWEYPVYFKEKHYGYVLAAIPYFKGNNWFPSTSWTGISHIPNHEVGNILSYPNYSNVVNNPDLEQLLYEFDTCELHATSENHMALTFTEFTSISDQTSWDFGMSINTSVWGWGVSLSTEAHYNKGEINTHKTSVSDQFEITIDMFDIDAEIGEVNYKVRPYAYRSQNGAIYLVAKSI
jgi:hypothetical protein